MGDSDLLPIQLRSSAIAEPIERLDGIYAKIDADQAAWMAKTPYRCPDGCGSCCETFEPDILEAEAWYLAAWISRNAPDRLGSIERNRHRGGCALADPDNPRHCTVYGGRPLICRLFAYAGDRGKSGRPRFKPCRLMPADGARQLDEAEILEKYGLLPPIMADYAQEAESLTPGGAGRRPLREALVSAADKLRYLNQLTGGGLLLRFPTPDSDDDTPGGRTPPVPKAG